MSYTKISFSTDISLSWNYPYTEGEIIAAINDMEATATSLKVMLPPANLAELGTSLIFNNVSANSFNIYGADSTNLVCTLSTSQSFTVYLIDNSTTAGEWRAELQSQGDTGVISLNVTASDSSIVVTNGSVASGASGNITIGTSEILSSFSDDFSSDISTGFVIRSTGGSTNAWSIRELIAGYGITISNPTGVAGNPQIALQNSISNLTNLNVGTLTLSSSTISSTGNIVVQTSADNYILLNSVKIDYTNNLTGINSLTTSGGVAISADNNISGIANISAESLTLPATGTVKCVNTAKAWVNFNDLNTGTTPLTNTINIQSSFNVTSVTGGNGVYTIAFTTPLSNAVYTPVLSLRHGQTSILPFAAYYDVLTTATMQILTVDTSGNLLPVTAGMSVVIYGN